MNNLGAGDFAALAYEQDERLLILHSPLGANDIVLTEFRGTQSLSTPFHYEIVFATSLPAAQVKRLLGERVTVLFGSTATQDRRPLNAIVRNLSGPRQGPRGMAIWHAQLVPQLALLAFSQDCRMFQHMSVPDILRQMFQIHKVEQVEFRGLTGTYPKLDYCVQYRETALAFVSRLMEHAGLFYWHEFTESQHVLVVTDSNQAAKPALDEAATLSTDVGNPDISQLTGDFSFRPGKWTLTDYDFTAPGKMLLSDTPTMVTEPAMTSYEIFDFPGHYQDVQNGNTLTRLRIEHEEMRFHELQGNSQRARFEAGTSLELEAADAQAYDVQGKLLLTSVTHDVMDRSYIAHDAAPAHYRNNFVAIPAERPYRPALVTKRPVVAGLQCAVVVGPPGEYIYTDEHGRVKVRFFWDRNPAGNPDENRSCWLRVSQAWADGKHGGVHLPRIGQEVLVEFLEGDPDRPLVTGRVYNGENAHPYPLPASKNQSGFKSYSIPPNGGWNEFYFEDTAGAEVLHMRAQKDHSHVVLNDHTQTIGHDHSHKVEHDHKIDIGNDVTHSVGHDHDYKLGNNLTETIGNTHEKTVGKDYNLKVKNNHTIEVVNNITINTGNSKTESVASSWFSTAPLKGAAYAFSTSSYGEALNFYGMKNDFAGIATTIYGVKADIGVLKCDIALFKTELKEGKVTKIGANFKAAAAKVETVPTVTLNTMINIQVNALIMFM